MRAPKFRVATTFTSAAARNEDARLLSGQALFVDDVELPGMVHAAFLRSNVAHARIRSIDVSAARARDGVVAVYTAADLGDYWAPGPQLVPPPPIADTIFNQRTQVPLAKCKVRHVGEPLAVVFAHSRHLAEDALSDIAVELDRLPAVVDLEKALTNTSLVHDDVRGNVAARVRQSRGNYAAARAQSTLSLAAFFTITAPRRRSRRAASSPNGTPAPISSRSWTPPRGRCSCAMALPACSA
jgi:aerobic carbon-monoxide dehydrogenase large subunit